jgi:DNA-binding MarR family transcriptional regulator
MTGEPVEDHQLQQLADIDQVIHAPARLMILSHLYVVESADYVFVMRITGLTWGNLATHLNKLEEEGYVEVQKMFRGKKPHSILRLTEKGRSAFRSYKRMLKQVLDDLPE